MLILLFLRRGVAERAFATYDVSHRRKRYRVLDVCPEAVERGRLRLVTKTTESDRPAYVLCLHRPSAEC